MESTNAALPSPRPRSSLRLFNALLFGSFAALGFGLVARPAQLAALSLGAFHPVLPWDVPLGRLFLVLALGLAVETLRLGLAVASGKRLRALARAPLLLLVLAALVARSQAGDPEPPLSATPRLITAMRLAADALDAVYKDRGHYDPEAAGLDAALSQAGWSMFVYWGREVPLHARVLEKAPRAPASPLAGDLPGTVEVSLSADRAQAILSAVTMSPAGAFDLLRTPTGKPLLIECHAGTHSAPGRDPIVPEYPGMQSAIGQKANALPH